jgi:hypothetical protein
MGGFVIATVFGWANWPDGWPGRDFLREHRIEIGVVLACLLASLFVPPAFRAQDRRLPSVFGPRDSFRTATTQIVSLIPPEARAVRVLARPALVFYAAGPLAARGVALGRVGSLADLLVPGNGWAIVDEVLLRQEGDVGAAMGRLTERWEVVARRANALSNATLLDVDPGAAEGNLGARVEDLILLRPKRGGNGP